MEIRFVEESLNLLPSVELREEVRLEYLKSMTPGSAGIDLRYMDRAALFLEPGERVKAPTGLCIWLQNPGLVGLIYPRSGLGSKGLVLSNLTGVIDSDYQGEIQVTLWNTSDETKVIEPGTRVAQYLISHRVPIEPNIVTEFSSETERGSGGFGSTGQ